MLERKRYPAGVPCWVDTAHPEPKEAADFYAGLFGWDFEDRGHGGVPYLVALLRGREVAAIGPQQPGLPETAAWLTHVAVDDAAATARRIEEAGGRTLIALDEIPGVGRGGWFADRSGAGFGIWQAKGRPGAVLVNEPGTWNFSELNTREPDDAIDFYGKVFGWEVETEELGTGDPNDTFTFFRLPGYGEFLAEQDPEIRERQAAAGAPGGFADAVAWLVPMPGDDSGGKARSHWSVTFAVADTDTTAAQAKELGATIVVPPFDAGVVRMSVITDPQGATFTASQYQPEARVDS